MNAIDINWVFASDIDNTLTGDAEALRKLATRLQSKRREQKLALFLSTGRRLDQVIDGVRNEGIPEADAVISQVGTEIYLPPFSYETPPLEEWNELLHRNFRRERAMQFLRDLEGVEIQPEMYNTPLKVSCYLDKTPDPEAAAAEIKARAADESDVYQVVWSSGRDLDIIPAAGGKGNAIRFLAEYLGLGGKKVVVAGDSGNDSSMFDAFTNGIVVANAKPELKEAEKERRDSGVYFAVNPYAAGVEEGLEHFGVL